MAEERVTKKRKLDHDAVNGNDGEEEEDAEAKDGVKLKTENGDKNEGDKACVEQGIEHNGSEDDDDEEVVD